jgi:tripartite-type tricarboxylate transporter receptor subunit TctC
VPTFKESGYNVVVQSWNGVWLPANTPDNIVAALSTAMREASQSKAMMDSLAKFATEPAFETPAQFSATVRSEMARWDPVVKESGFVALD